MKSSCLWIVIVSHLSGERRFPGDRRLPLDLDLDLERDLDLDLDRDLLASCLDDSVERKSDGSLSLSLSRRASPCLCGRQRAHEQSAAIHSHTPRRKPEPSQCIGMDLSPPSSPPVRDLRVNFHQKHAQAPSLVPAG
jgi:hypothetical protein